MKMAVKLAVLLLITAVFMTACETPPEQSEETEAIVYQKITAAQARAMLSEADHPILLDVRTNEEYHEQHIPEAILLPYDEISARAYDELPDKDALILVYCRSGRRSALAAKELITMGYTNVYDFGGIIDWFSD